MKTMAKAHRNRSSVNGSHFFKKLMRVSRRGTRIPVEHSYAILTGLEAGKLLWGFKCNQLSESLQLNGNPPNQSPKVFQDTAQAVDAARSSEVLPHRARPSVPQRRSRATARIASAVPKGRAGN